MCSSTAPTGDFLGVWIPLDSLFPSHSTVQIVKLAATLFPSRDPVSVSRPWRHARGCRVNASKPECRICDSTPVPGARAQMSLLDSP